MFARVASAAVVGIEAAPIDVEVDVAVGLPCCNIVGLADAGIREAASGSEARSRTAASSCRPGGSR
jgi:magnesium chelatase family protein